MSRVYRPRRFLTARFVTALSIVISCGALAIIGAVLIARSF